MGHPVQVQKIVMLHTRYLCELDLEYQGLFQLFFCPLSLRGAQQLRRRLHVGKVVLHIRLLEALDQKLPGGNYIEIGLPGKLILRDFFQENRTSLRLFPY